MSGRVKIYIGILVLLFTVVIVLDMNQPKPVNWQPSYSPNDKIPLGLFILDKELPGLIDAKVTKFGETPYEYLEARYDYDTLVKDYDIKGSLLVIAQQSVIDTESAKEFFYFANHGNNVMLSMKSFPEALLDSLNIETRNAFRLTDSIAVRMANPKLGSQKYYLEEDASTTYFSNFDTINTTVLGYQETDSMRANFIKVHYNGGDFYLHTQPAAFTNFHLLKGNHRDYAAKVLSYIGNRDVYWHTKSKDDSISSSPLRFIFSQPALAWAWYLFVFGMVFFMIFHAKRKQRVVPIIEPLANTTVEFAKTIGNLYYQEGDHNTIIDKKIIYFLEKIRNDYLMDTTTLDNDFIRRLHQKSGKDIADIDRVVHLINMHRKSYHGSVESDLIQINNAIEKITL